ncbi:MAG: AAA family ATPase [Bacteroidota bacterium]
MAKSSLHIGTGDFMDLVSGDVFVDKTLLIKDILTDGDLKALLITRPRRWGKTLNMSMLYNFLHCEVRKKEDTCELTAVNPHPGLFDNLNIGKEHPEIIASHQGKWPVMFLTFKDLVGGSILDMEKESKVLFQELYDQHAYLSTWLNELEKTPSTLAKAKYFSDVIEKKVDLAELENSLYFLSRLLYEYY